MAFVQKLSSASVRNFTALLSKAQESVAGSRQRPDRPNLKLVHPQHEPVAEHQPDRAIARIAVQFGVPKQARARATEMQRHQNAVLDYINASLQPELQLKAGSILPIEAFQHDIGKFLMLACDVYVCSPINTYLTPASPQAAEYLGLPFIPADMPEVLHDTAISKVKWLRESVMIEHRRCAVAIQHGDISVMLQSSERKQAYLNEVATILRDLAIARCGSSAWQIHETRFRTTIQGT